MGLVGRQQKQSLNKPTRGQILTEWETCCGRHTWGTGRKNGSGDLYKDVRKGPLRRGHLLEKGIHLLLDITKYHMDVHQRQSDIWAGQ